MDPDLTSPLHPGQILRAAQVWPVPVTWTSSPPAALPWTLTFPPETLFAVFAIEGSRVRMAKIWPGPGEAPPEENLSYKSFYVDIGVIGVTLDSGILQGVKGTPPAAQRRPAGATSNPSDIFGI